MNGNRSDFSWTQYRQHMGIVEVTVNKYGGHRNVNAEISLEYYISSRREDIPEYLEYVLVKYLVIEIFNRKCDERQVEELFDRVKSIREW